LDGTAEYYHATTIALSGRAAMIRGASGAGKSDLALRCLSVPAGFAAGGKAKLVADDQSIATRDGDDVIVSAPAALTGMIEVRGLGIFRVPAITSARLDLIVDLVARDEIERMPESVETVSVAGRPVRRIALDPFEASAPLKLLLALAGTPAFQGD
jgi:serine kinase of HPr protein (carbohydrate metabolism regulator)